MNVSKKPPEHPTINTTETDLSMVTLNLSFTVVSNSNHSEVTQVKISKTF